MATEQERIEAGEMALEVLKYLDEEGDTWGKCVDNRCRSSPCRPDCRLSAALKKAGMKE